jgi:predicted phage tail protein
MGYVALLGLVLLISPILLGEVCWRVPGPFCNEGGGWLAFLGFFYVTPIGLVLLLVGIGGLLSPKEKEPSNDDT